MNTAGSRSSAVSWKCPPRLVQGLGLFWISQVSRIEFCALEVIQPGWDCSVICHINSSSMYSA